MLVSQQAVSLFSCSSHSQSITRRCCSILGKFLNNTGYPSIGLLHPAAPRYHQLLQHSSCRNIVNKNLYYPGDRSAIHCSFELNLAKRLIQSSEASLASRSRSIHSSSVNRIGAGAASGKYRSQTRVRQSSRLMLDSCR